ncbi:MAG: RNA polymerase sigma factor [Thermoleophilia bacterium]|nr:RNA polymerase sigma factor [Thermoleophilia bacterium]
MNDQTTQPGMPASDVTSLLTIDDDAWLRGLVGAHALVLRRIAVTQVGPDAADDAVSEAFATAWRDRATFDPTIASERAWLAGIVLNRCLAMDRAHRRWVKRAARQLPDAASADVVDATIDRMGARRIAPSLLRALEALPADQRVVLLLVARADLAPTDIAAALSMPAATVRSHLHRARRALAAALDLDGNCHA